MAKAGTGQESDPKIVYADIIHLPRWQSPVRPRMSLYDRAAQFLPYKTLSGYEDMVEEENRETEAAAELSEDEKEELSQKLNLIADLIAGGRTPVVTFTCFVPDPKKSGGSFVTRSEAVRRIDPVARRIFLARTAGRSGAYETIDIDSLVRLDL